MKVHKMVCLDWELAQKLNGLNASALVNKLLTAHFEVNPNYDHLTLPEKKLLLEKIQLHNKHKKEMKKYDRIQE